MEEKLGPFLLGLSDPEALSEYLSDPDAAIAKAGLSKAEIAILKSGSTDLIARAVFGQLPIFASPEHVKVNTASAAYPLNHKNIKSNTVTDP